MGQNTRVIREHNKQNREQLAHDIDALTHKLDPKVQAHEAKEHVKEKVATAVTDKVDTIKEKIGMDTSKNTSGGAQVPNQVSDVAGHAFSVMKTHPIGAFAFIYGAKSMLAAVKEQQARHARSQQARAYRADGHVNYYQQSSGPGLKDKASHVASEAADTVSGATSSAAGAVTDAAGAVSNKASSVASAVGQRLPSDVDEARYMAKQNWGALGVGALALGALVGYLTPNTRFENERLGEVKEDLVDQAKEKADTVKDAAQTTGTQVLDQAKDAGYQILDQAKETSAQIVDQAKEQAKSTADEAKETFKDEVRSDASSADMSAETDIMVVGIVETVSVDTKNDNSTF